MNPHLLTHADIRHAILDHIKDVCEYLECTTAELKGQSSKYHENLDLNYIEIINPEDHNAPIWFLLVTPEQRDDVDEIWDHLIECQDGNTLVITNSSII